MAASDTQTPQDAADAALMLRIVNQDQAALMELYERFGGQVYGLTLRVLQDPQLAEEATQDTFLKVWHKSEQWDISRGQLSSWLLTIARYAAIDRLRREQRHSSSTGPYLDSLADHASAPAAFGDRRWMDGQLLRQYITTLPQEQALDQPDGEPAGDRAGFLSWHDAQRTGRAPSMAAGHGENKIAFWLAETTFSLD